MTTAVTSTVFSSLSEEWYTPAPYVEAARKVMGGIDIDPASNPLANETIKAKTFYTKETDGFDKPWTGRVWLNPPYGSVSGKSNQERWSARLVASYYAGITTEAVLLVTACTERKWFFPLWRFPICFTNHRIKFYTPEGTPQQPINGNALVYMGPNVDHFVEQFSPLGIVASAVQFKPRPLQMYLPWEGQNVIA